MLVAGGVVNGVLPAGVPPGAMLVQRVGPGGVALPGLGLTPQQIAAQLKADEEARGPKLEVKHDEHFNMHPSLYEGVKACEFWTEEVEQVSGFDEWAENVGTQ